MAKAFRKAINPKCSAEIVTRLLVSSKQISVVKSS